MAARLPFVSFGLLHRIPPQPEDREPGTLPAELQTEDDGDEYGTQELFVPADVETEEGLHSSSQLSEWRKQEQEQWNREIQARSMHSASQPTPLDDTPKRSSSSHSLPRANTPGRSPPINGRSTPTRTQSPLGNLMNGNSSQS